MTRYKWIRYDGDKLFDIGINDDGSLFNPSGYDDDHVRAAIAYAQQREKERRSIAAKKAAETRRRRQEEKTYVAARRLIAGEVFGPRKYCFLCGKHLGDPQSIERGIGSDCWQFILSVMSSIRINGAPV